MKRVLFLTNGHGEDLVAAEIIRELKDKIIPLPFPLVGNGSPLSQLGLELLGSKKKLPSGGFSLRNLTFLLKDLAAGLIGSTLANFHQLEKLRSQVDLTVAIGDIVPLLGALTIQKPYFFIGVNKSAYYRWFGYNYTPWEIKLLRRTAQLVFTRDEITKHFLNQHQVMAEYLGNPLMDCLGGPVNRPPQNEAFTLGLLPGSRGDAGLNLADFQKVIESLISFKEPDSKYRFIAATTLTELPEYVEKVPFPSLLSQADLVLGLAGTANEQAVGCGLPVVSFFGRGSQYNKKFALAQKQLLGRALLLMETRDFQRVAAGIINLVKRPEIREKMGRAGRVRLGPPGACRKAAEYIRHYCNA